jgi:acetyltransferase-like isoleucine patch superfamily enzyme
MLIRKLKDVVFARRDASAFARSLGVRVGVSCRLLRVSRATFGTEPYLISLGDHVTVTAGVRFITHDGGLWVFRSADPDVDLFTPIIIGTNVFVGLNAIILPGVRVGDNCVIGAGAVVTKSVPSGSIVAGNPARIVGNVESYWAKIEGRVERIRSMSIDQKRARLLQLLGSDGFTMREPMA